MLSRYPLNSDLSVAKSGTGNTNVIDLEPCRKFSVTVVPDTTHTYGVKVNWAPDILSGDGKVQEQVIASASQGNIVSALLECKADQCLFEIANGDAGNDHTYDVYVHRME